MSTSYAPPVQRLVTELSKLPGVGSRTAGARWNPPKSFPTVYSSLDPHTALDEVLAHFRYYKIPVESAMPRVTVSVRSSAEGSHWRTSSGRRELLDR